MHSTADFPDIRAPGVGFPSSLADLSEGETFTSKGYPVDTACYGFRVSSTIFRLKTFSRRAVSGGSIGEVPRLFQA
ncbi:MAG: hypothetical protein ACP5G4_06975 [bacterium]